MTRIGGKYGLSCSQVGIAWALSKGTMPIIGATKERHVLGRYPYLKVVVPHCCPCALAGFDVNLSEKQKDSDMTTDRFDSKEEGGAGRMTDAILSYNKRFVAEKAWEPYVTDKYPAKKLAVLTCMDTRLTELLPKALGLRNGDAKIIRNAGGLILSETDSTIRSLLVGIYELGVREVMVVHHTNCGACHMNYRAFRPHMLASGVAEETLARWEDKGIAGWLEGFHDTEASVRRTVAAIVNHPLVPEDVVVRGFIIDSVTGELTECAGC